MPNSDYATLDYYPKFDFKKKSKHLFILYKDFKIDTKQSKINTITYMDSQRPFYRFEFSKKRILVEETKSNGTKIRKQIFEMIVIERQKIE